MQERPVQSLSQQDPLESGMATHSSILARKIPWAEEPGRLLYSPWGHKESDVTQAHIQSPSTTTYHPVFLPRENCQSIIFYKYVAVCYRMIDGHAAEESLGTSLQAFLRSNRTDLVTTTL